MQRPEPYVLGGVTIYIPSNTDLNTLQTVGVAYACNTGSTTITLLHRPSDLTEAFTMYCLAGIKTQIIITTWGALKLYKRTLDAGSGNWYKWQKVTGTEVEYAE